MNYFTCWSKFEPVHCSNPVHQTYATCTFLTCISSSVIIIIISQSSSSFPSVLWHCWLGDRKGIRPVKKTGCWFVGGDDLTHWSFAWLTAPVVTTASIILCFNKHRLTRVHLENGCWNGERISHRRSCHVIMHLIMWHKFLTALFIYLIHQMAAYSKLYNEHKSQ